MINYLLSIAALLFCVGLVGLMVRRNVLVVLMCIELMLNSVNLTLIVFARQLGDMTGHIMVFMVIAVAAVEVAVGLGIILSVFRVRDTLNVDRFNLLRH